MKAFAAIISCAFVASVSAQTAAVPIVGGFGFTLGQKLPDRVKAVQDTNTMLFTVFVDATNFQPFDAVTVMALPDRTVYSITGSSLSHAWPTKSTAVLASLQQTFGPGQTNASGRDSFVIWRDGKSTVRLSGRFLIFRDEKLSRTADQVRAVTRQKPGAL